MYIEPNSDIYILQNVPIDNTYMNTLYFDGSTEQAQYFTSKRKYLLNKQSYQRENKNVIRAQVLCDNLYDCNYLMFRNTNFSNKWFYAFITNVEYINNSVTAIHYEIDVMQTWYYELEWLPSFVEREHILNDYIGANTMPENVEVGEYVYNGFFKQHYPEDSGDLVVGVLTTFGGDDFDSFPLSRKILGNFTACHLYILNTITELQEWVAKVTEAGKSDGIVACFMLPKKLANTIAFPDPIGNTIDMSMNLALDRYFPRNKKLLTYPYNILYVSNNQGTTAIYRWELFNNIWQGAQDPDEQITVQFLLEGTVVPFVEFGLRPINYKDGNPVEGSVSERLNNDEMLTANGYQQVAWSTDTYEAWWAQNATAFSVNGLASLAKDAGAGAILGGGVGALVGGGISLFNTITSVMAQKSKYEIMPPQANGTSTGSVKTAVGVIGFDFYYKTITQEYAERIDQFFDMFGYSTNMIKIPNIGTRPHWNYVKTAGAQLKGSIPNDDMSVIKSNFDRGITFWMHPSEVGDYSLDNRS